MSTAQTLEIFKVLRKYFKNEDDVSRVVEDLQKVIDNKFEEKKTELATKQDLSDLRLASQQDLNNLRVKLIK